MASTTRELTVPEAISIAKQHQHGENDPSVTSVLARTADDIWQRLKAQPSTYVLTKEEFAVLTYYRGVFGDDEVVQQAIARFWNQSPRRPLDDQMHEESKSIHEEIPELAFPQNSDTTPLPSRQGNPELQSSFKPFIPRLRHKSDRQSLPDESTAVDDSLSNESAAVDNDRAAYACRQCRFRKIWCDKELPACQSCKRLKLPCVYMNSRGNKTFDRVLKDIQVLKDMRKTFTRESGHVAVSLQQDSVQLEDASGLQELGVVDKNQVADGCERYGHWKTKRIGGRAFCQYCDEENNQALTRNILEARSTEIFNKREMAWEGHREPTQSNIPWVSGVGKQDGSTPQTWKVDLGYLGSPEGVGVINPDEKSEVLFETRSKRNQSTISEDSQLTQSEPTPQTPQVHRRHPESPESLCIDLARSVHTSNGEEYGLVNSIKIWVQSLTRESWDWWPLHPSFRQLREDEVRIKRYCVSHYPRCLNLSLLNLLKEFRARTLDCAPQDRTRSFIRNFEE